jgi:hypothetical protein
METYKWVESNSQQYVLDMRTTRWRCVAKLGLQLFRIWRQMRWVPKWERALVDYQSQSVRKGEKKYAFLSQELKPGSPTFEAIALTQLSQLIYQFDDTIWIEYAIQWQGL